MKFFILTLLLFLVGCENPLVEGGKSTADVPYTPLFDGPISAPLGAPVAGNISPAAFNEDTQSIITLSYSDTENDLATACSLSSLTNVTVTQACSCDGAGICIVGVTGALNANGAASFTYTVTTNSVVSNSATATLSITAVNDAPTMTAITAKSTGENTSTAAIAVVIADVDNTLTCASSLSMTTTDQAKVLDASVVWAGTAPNCTAVVSPVANISGTVDLTFIATDGTLTASQTFTLTITTKRLALSWTPHYTDLAAYWQFTGTPGSNITNGAVITAVVGDNLTFNNSGNLTSPATGIIASPTAQGIAFSGNSLTALESYSYPNTQNFTIMTWIKFTHTTSWERIISNSNARAGEKGFLISINPDLTGLTVGGGPNPGSFAIALGASNNVLTESVNLRTTGGPYNDGVWHHLVVVYNQVNQTINVYVDGVGQNVSLWGSTCSAVLPGGKTVDYSVCTNATNGAPSWTDAMISGWAGGYEALTNSTGLSEIAIFTSTLSAADVAVIYNRQK